ncbi:hypothetical protein GGI35DRAFT_457593 [Trichoderma velutinum]
MLQHNKTDIIPNSPALDILNTSGKVVVLNGFPGIGKFTILKRVKELLPAGTTCFLDNHLLIDPVVAVIPDRSDEHHELRRMIRAPIFEKLRKRAQEGHTILMTACLADNQDKDIVFLNEHFDIVRGTGVPIVWVNAYCDQALLEQRLQSPERCQGTKTKLTDVHVLRDLLRTHHLVDPSKWADGRVTKLVVKTLDMSGPVEVSVSRLMSAIDGC